MKTYSGAVAALLLASTAAFAAGGNGNQGGNGNGGTPGSGTNPGGNGGFVTQTFTTSVDTKYMGMSNKTPPNDHAAASQGTRTETTTTTISVNGPKGQVANYDPTDPASACNNCEITTVSSTTETTDLPGANR